MNQLDRIELKLDLALELLPVVAQFATADKVSHRREVNRRYKKIIQKYNEKYENLDNSASEQNDLPRPRP